MNATVPSDFIDTDWAPGEPQPIWNFIGIPDSMNVVNATEYSVDYESWKILALALFNGIVGTVEFDGVAGKPVFRGLGGSTTAIGASVIQSVWLSSNTTATMSSRFEVLTDTYTAYMRSALLCCHAVSDAATRRAALE